MVDFAIRTDDMPEGQAKWVLAVEGERVLTADDEGSLVWKDMADCKLIKAHTPDQPLMVVVVQPQPQSGLQVPELNRAMRRNGHN